MDKVIQFNSAFDAVRFALCYSMQQYGKSIMARQVSPIGSGMGLVGLDGAGQAGMIRRQMWALPELYLAVLVARAAPRDLPCDCGRPCCSKRKTNPEWKDAITWLTDASAGYASGFSHYRVRRAIIERIFGIKNDLAEVTKNCDAHRNTVSNHNIAVRRWILGDKKTDEPGVEQSAWLKIEQGLFDNGLLCVDRAA